MVHALYVIILSLSIYLGLITVSKSQHSIQHKLFAGISFCSSGWVAANYLLWTLNSPLLWNKVAYGFSTALIEIILLFSLVYPKKHIAISLKSIILLSILPIVLISIIPTPLILAQITENGQLIFGPLQSLWNIYFTLYVSIFLAISVWGSIYYEKTEKIKVRILCLSMGLSLIVASISNLILPLMGVSKYYHLGPLAMIFFVLGAYFSVVKQDFIEIKVIISKTSSFMITLGFMGISYLIIHTVSYEFRLKELPIVIVWSIFWAIMFSKCHFRIQTYAEKKFLKGYADIPEILRDISILIAHQNDKESVINSVFKELFERLDISKSHLFLKQNNSYKKFIFDKHLQKNTTVLDLHSELISHVYNINDVIQFHALPQKLKQELFSLDIQDGSLILPIHSIEDLQAIIIISPKLSEEPFSLREFDMFTSILNQVIIVFDRITKHEQLIISHKELERLNKLLAVKVDSQGKEIEEKRKIEADLKLAHEIQVRLLPDRTPKVKNYQFDALFQPAKVVSGDYYDFMVFSEEKIGIFTLIL